MVSDGTLRLTALTLLAYVSDLEGIFLIEEPENGIHPTAVAAAYDSLSSLYDAQVLLASHSPVVLSEARMDDVLCFAKDLQGATDIVLGSEHPALRNWQDAACLRRTGITMQDLIVLTADNDMSTAMKGILSRHQSLAIRSITTTVLRHPGRDPGCALRGVEFLTRYADQYQHGLLIFDHEGSGKEQTDRTILQEELNSCFVPPPWNGRAKAIVIGPELEAWVWSDSPEVDSVLRWGNRAVPLRDWLTNKGWLSKGGVKPNRPKEALQATLRRTRTPRSASLYKKLAERVSFSRCEDPAFLELKAVLQEWFQNEAPNQEL